MRHGSIAGAIGCIAIAAIIALAWGRSDRVVDTVGWQTGVLTVHPSTRHVYMEIGLVSIGGQMRLVWQVSRDDQRAQWAISNVLALSGNGWATVPASAYRDGYVAANRLNPGAYKPIAWPGAMKFGARYYDDYSNPARLVAMRGWQVGVPDGFLVSLALATGIAFAVRWRWTRRSDRVAKGPEVGVSV